MIPLVFTWCSLPLFMNNWLFYYDIVYNVFIISTRSFLFQLLSSERLSCLPGYNPLVKASRFLFFSMHSSEPTLKDKKGIIFNVNHTYLMHCMAFYFVISVKGSNAHKSMFITCLNTLILEYWSTCNSKHVGVVFIVTPIFFI